MKKITAIVPDNIDGALLGSLLSVAIHFNIESVEAKGGGQKPEHATRRNLRVSGQTTQSVIMAHYTANGVITKDLAEKWLSEKGYAPSSGTPALSVLVRAGYLKQLSNNKLQFEKPFAEGQIKV